MPTTTGLTFVLNGMDRTAAACQSARGNFAVLSQSIRNEFLKIQQEAQSPLKRLPFMQRVSAGFMALRYGAASAATVLRTAAAPVLSVAKSMHELSDRAAEAGSGMADLQRLSFALGELGVKAASVEDLARTLNYMRRTTGEQGVEGFKRQMAAIAALNDAQERATELVRVFGRAGASLDPLLRAGPEAFLAGLEAVEANMPKLSEEAARTASALDVGLGAVMRDMKQTWTGWVAGFAGALSEKIGKPLDTALQHAWQTVKTYLFAARELGKAFALSARDRLVALGTWIGEAAVQVWNNLSGLPRRFLEAWKSVGNALAEIGNQIWNALSGRGFDWGAVVEKAVDAAKKSATVLTGELQFTAFEFEDRMERAVSAIAGRLDREDASHAAVDAAKEAAETISAHAAAVSDAGADAAGELANGADKVSNALKPAAWTDAASYAARTLAATAATAGPERSPANFRALERQDAAPQSALTRIVPLVSQLLEAVKQSGAEAKSFYSRMSSLGVV